ncbi:MAG: MerR family transcriptional regulator [Sedimentisphaerales bacterium]|nr:MerR family transcriptional regulator [Sedimentisphaerales bacterium]
MTESGNKARGPSERLLRTAEAAEAAGVSKQTLQYYLLIGLVEPTGRTEAGHQLFDDQAVRRIRLIKQVSDSGYSLRDIREIFLNDKNPPPS